MPDTDRLYMPADHMDVLYNSKNPLVRYVHRKRISSVTRNIPSDAKKILDAGCGEGHLFGFISSRFPGADYTGVDVTDVALSSARSRYPQTSFKKMDITNLDFEDNVFDAVLLTEVIEHIYDYKKAIDECIRVLKPGGVLIITFPNELLWTVSRFLLGRRPIKVPDHVNSFTPKRIDQCVSHSRIHREGIPFTLIPFCLSLGCLLAFRKSV